MATTKLNKSTVEQKLVWYNITCTYLFFLSGSLYVTGCMLGWLLISNLILRWNVRPNTIKEPKVVPAIIWLWIAMMLIMLFTLFIAHANWDLGLLKTIKSTIGWMKGWALFPIFIFIGYFANINEKMLVRAVCKVSFYTLIFALVTILIYLFGASGEVYISPLQVIGGPGVEFFSVSLFGINPETGLPRWRFFGPWAPAAGFMACIYLVLCLQEHNNRWRVLGIAGCVVMILLSQSRAGLFIFIFLIPFTLFLDKALKLQSLLLLGLLLPIFIIFSDPITQLLFDHFDQIKQSRPGSTRVRAALADIAIQRWQSEAPIWGHGIVERGPKLVESMQIGSHHTWYGLLYVKGLVGLLCLAIPMTATSCYLFYLSVWRTNARIALALMVVFWLYSFYENLEILAFIFWPALIYIGLSLKPCPADKVHLSY
ncbi:O-antigen ligase domain-containing protein [Thalassotalea psychrophila]|uniref:O-antigen ligase domain-containing protein n=1 Tax=Thalassotalea psychrophila TaxID=3065647 RepID=A0ABY9TPF5_9GAMM|nr:O-antigen ligase domain-containing protein [Colwelliaceae bacterium SQ149]